MNVLRLPALRWSLLALLVASPALLAQTYPDRPITIVVPYPPGASTDQVARVVAPKLQAAMGQAVVVENRPGADGSTGAAFVAKGPPDGYRILIATQPVISINPHLQRRSDFDPLTQLAPLTSAVNAVMAIAVTASLPVDNLAGLLAYAKRNPGKLSFGTAGVGSPQHLGGLLLGERAGIQWTHVPYRGGAPMVSDLLAGHIQVGIATLAVFKPLMDGGQIKVLAVGDKVRYAGTPDVPTISETLPGFELTTWLGFYGPRGLPAEVAARLSNELGRALRAPDVYAQLQANALLVNAEGPGPLDRVGHADYASYGKVIADHHITVE
jgi:tripartite-type tricarboxylate transporter receptor subunit TctC